MECFFCLIYKMRKGLHAQTVGREANSAQSCDDGIVAITEAALPR